MTVIAHLAAASHPFKVEVESTVFSGFSAVQISNWTAYYSKFENSYTGDHSECLTRSIAHLGAEICPRVHIPSFACCNWNLAVHFAFWKAQISRKQKTFSKIWNSSFLEFFTRFSMVPILWGVRIFTLRKTGPRQTLRHGAELPVPAANLRSADRRMFRMPTAWQQKNFHAKSFTDGWDTHVWSFAKIFVARAKSLIPLTFSNYCSMYFFGFGGILT